MTSLSLPVLIVDDEPQTLLSFSVLLRSAGIENILTIEDSREVFPLLSSQEVAVIVLDLSMPYLSGMELLTRIKIEYPGVPIIIMTAVNELEIAVKCMKEGAFDYLVKPVEKSRFISCVKNALEIRHMQDEISSLKQHLLLGKIENEKEFSFIVTCSKKMEAIFQYIEVIAGSGEPVLITGETGVGKELIARAIHNISRRKGEFIAVNGSGLDDTVFSDTIFGHKKGAYTGAGESRDGLIARASGGTLFLDEIGDMSESSQLKLLRVIQEHEYYPLGSDIPKRTSARIVVATNQDIQSLITLEKFRKDLYYRLRVHQIHIPPLRERREDIGLLFNYFLEEAAKGMRKKKPSHPFELITLLSNWHFPGNVRELRSMVFDAVARHKSGILSMDSFEEDTQKKYLPPHTDSSSASVDTNHLLDLFGRFPTLKELEEYLISTALKNSNGNQGTAASLLGITRQALNKRLIRKTRSNPQL